MTNWSPTTSSPPAETRIASGRFVCWFSHWSGSSSSWRSHQPAVAPPAPGSSVNNAHSATEKKVPRLDFSPQRCADFNAHEISDALQNLSWAALRQRGSRMGPEFIDRTARSFVRGAPQMDAPSEASSSMAPRFDRTAYQREYMRQGKRRLAPNSQRAGRRKPLSRAAGPPGVDPKSGWLAKDARPSRPLPPARARRRASASRQPACSGRPPYRASRLRRAWP